VTPALLLGVLEEARQAGFLGPGPVTRHVELAGAFVAAAPPPAWGVDLGSGGGVPGLVLAQAWPDSRWVLLDRSARRTAFLRRAVVRLGWTHRVEVRTGDAELTGTDPDHRGRHDLVVARSFGPPAVTAECAAPMLQVGGRLVVSEPPDTDPDRWPAASLAELGLAARRVVPAPARVQVLEQVAACPGRFPRRTAAKRPLW